MRMTRQFQEKLQNHRPKDEEISEANTLQQNDKDHDALLKKLVLFIEKERDPVIHIIFNIKGLVVSGILISQREYCERLLQTAMKEVEPQYLERLRGSMSEICQANETRDELDDITYTHLKDARFHYAYQDSVPLEQGVLWRGRISSIDAFVLGTLPL